MTILNGISGFAKNALVEVARGGITPIEVGYDVDGNQHIVLKRNGIIVGEITKAEEGVVGDLNGLGNPEVRKELGL